MWETTGAMRGCFGAVGLAMFLGFGALFVGALAEVRADPLAPRDGLFIAPPFALMGLFILGFYWQPQAAPRTRLEDLEAGEGEPAWSPDERVLPPGPVRFTAVSVYYRVLSVLGLGSMVWIMFLLTWLAPAQFGGAWGWLAATFFGALGLLLLLGGVKLVAGWRSHAALDATRTEAWAKVISQAPLLANGVDVGNRKLVFLHPLSGKPMERVLPQSEAAPLVARGHLFVVWATDPAALIVVGEGLEPFELPPPEQRAALRRLRRWAATR